MNRREVVRVLGSAVCIPVLARHRPEDLFLLGQRLNALVQREALPSLFDPHQRATVSAIAECIIPETDTPGAQAAGVPQFIELIVAEHYHTDERTRFLAGLVDLDHRSRAEVGQDFAAAKPAEQQRILLVLEQEFGLVPKQKPPEKKPLEPSQKPEEKPAEKPREAQQEKPVEQPAPFWQQIKFLTIYGYYTSEIGVNRELHMVTIPGRYDPCVATGVHSPTGR